MRERWFGATGRRVPEIAVEGDVDLADALVLDAWDDSAHAAFESGRPIVIRASSSDEVLAALSHPEVACALVTDPKLLELDLVRLTYGREPPVSTYSIVACDLESRQWGVATQSKFLAVGSVVPWAAAEVGAIATQSYANPQYGPDGLDLLRQGLPAEEVVKRLTEADDGRESRQLGVVDAEGRAATFTGGECHDWAGGRTGDGYAAQGNILVDGATVDALATTFEATAGKALAERLIECLAAAQLAGGDKRGQQSAALLVVEQDGGYARLTDVVVDLRVDDHAQPIEELRRLYGLHEELFGRTPKAKWLPVDDALRDELTERLAAQGYTGELAVAFSDWAGTENLEMRVDGVESIDPIVLEALRRQA